jgi:quercetin dioxygenase-like cupin family protein
MSLKHQGEEAGALLGSDESEEGQTWSEIKLIEGVRITGMRGRQIVQGAYGSLLEAELEQGNTIPRHQHAHESYCFVLSGRLEVKTDSGLSALSAGEAMTYPPLSDHEITATETTRWLEFQVLPPG